jgi:hypothetical protein
MLCLRLSGFALLCALGWCAASAAAQDAPPEPTQPPAQPSPPPAQPLPPAQRVPPAQPAQPVPADPAPDPGVPPQAPPWVDSQPPPPAEAVPPAPPPPSSTPAEPAPQPATRYEGQVGPDESAAAYGNEFEAEDDPYADKKSGNDFEMPAFSIRMDPFNWLIEGRLGFELEVAVWKFISVELVPVFVANDEPPSFNFSGRDDPISQHSNGLGPIAGTSIGAGFWLSGEPLEGYVLRAILTNYGFTYRASDRIGVFDEVDFTERRLMVFFGSHSRWGFFTLSGGIGLAYELNQQQRCFASGSDEVATSGCPDEDEQHILVESDGSAVADINGGFHPIYLEARFSLGIAID